MNNVLAKDLQQISQLLHEALNEGVDYLSKIDTIPTSVPRVERQTTSLEELGYGGQLALIDFIDRYREIMVASTGPRYWGFVTGGATPAALMGDLLATIYDQNTQTDNGHGDISAIIEFETIQLLLDLFGLPKNYLGGFVTGATMSNFTCLGVGRQWLGKKLGLDIAKQGMSVPLHVLSATPHSSSIKSLSMLGIGSQQITKIKTIDETREAIDVADLEEKILALNGTPFILITSAGTVNTVDYDDFKAIASLKEKYDFWWHIDAAFGAFAVLSPDHAHLLNGWDQADSITVDGHKWLNVPYENAFFFIKEKHKMLQVETFQNSNAPYLGDPLDNFNYLNFLPENSRRLKALSAWFSLKAYGRKGYEEIVCRNIKQAQSLGAFIEASNYFELLAPIRLNTACFTLKGVDDLAKINNFLSRLNDTGKVFMTPTSFRGKAGIRAALVNWRTTDEDVILVQDLMVKAATV